MADRIGKSPSGSHRRSQQTSRSLRQPNRKSPFKKGLFWGFAVSLTAATSAIVGASIALRSPSSFNLVNSLQHSTDNKIARSEDTQRHLSRPLNILVMGIDRVAGASKNSPEAFTGYSDAMFLLRVDPGDRAVRILSIPRDTAADTSEFDLQKINEANVQGGPALASKVVSQTLNGLPIDRYIRITTDALRESIDLVGGVEVYVPYSMSYVDLAQNLEIDLKAGWQTLDGNQAEEFVRFKSDLDGDLGRVQRQQVLLQALGKQLYNPAVLPRLAQATRLWRQQIDTNLSLEEMLSLVDFGRNLTQEDITMVILPGRWQQEKRSWIVVKKERDRAIDDYFNHSAQTVLAAIDPYRIKIAVQNATNDPQMGDRVVKYLMQREFRNVYLVSDSPQLLPETEIVTQKGNLEAANALKTTFKLGRVEASSTGDLDSDLTIRIGADVKHLFAGESFVSDQ
jgi:polyisoprenyl-teichoic acid--peptidoglycan teichoic acid transferase